MEGSRGKEKSKRRKTHNNNESIIICYEITKPSEESIQETDKCRRRKYSIAGDGDGGHLFTGRHTTHTHTLSSPLQSPSEARWWAASSLPAGGPDSAGQEVALVRSMSPRFLRFIPSQEQEYRITI